MKIHISLLLVSVLISSIAHVMLKNGAEACARYSLSHNLLSNYWLMAGVIGHVLALVLWVYCLGRVPLSFAYPFLALGYVFVAIFSHLYLGEIINGFRVLGIGLIVSGMYFILKSA